MRRLTFMTLVVVIVACGSRTQLDDDRSHDATIDGPTDSTDARTDVDAGDVIFIPPLPSIATQELTCVVQTQGTVKCWGQAPIGDGTETNAYVARAIPTLSASRIGTMGLATCALGTDGGILCWGRGNNFELGLGLDTSSIADDAGNVASPLPLTIAPSQALTAGKNNACVIAATGDAICWGQTLSDHQSGLPTAVVELSENAVQIAEGDDFQCSVLRSGLIECWGGNASGQIGVGHVSVQEAIGAPVVGISDAVAVAAGANHACALRKGGTVVCWGEGTHGELGDGIEPDGGPRISASPVETIGLGTDTLAIRAGGHATCVITAGGGAKCWGANQLGNLGDGTVVSRATPKDVFGLQAGVLDLALSQTRTCAIVSDGRAKCWGAGPLGDGDASIAGSSTPIDVIGVP